MVDHSQVCVLICIWFVYTNCVSISVQYLLDLAGFAPLVLHGVPKEHTADAQILLGDRVDVIFSILLSSPRKVNLVCECVCIYFLDTVHCLTVVLISRPLLLLSGQHPLLTIWFSIISTFRFVASF